MFLQFFASVQQDFKLFIFFPILCAVFRAIFIEVHKPYPSLAGKGKALWPCFRFGFWWGMDINAYLFPIGIVLITLPGLFLSVWADWGDGFRLAIGLVYAAVLYIAFAAKMIFYAQFHDIFNNIIFLGKKAEKHNLVDIFFHQYHGLRVLALAVVYLVVIALVLHAWLATPTVPYPPFTGVAYYVFNTVFVLFCIALFYYCRYGGTFLHDNKPEWDTIPAVVKEDPFLAKATVDDLIALKILRKHPMNETMQKSDTENLENVRPFIEKRGSTVPPFENAFAAFRHEAQGTKMAKPSHIFLIVGESYSQQYLEPYFADLHIADEGKKLLHDEHTAFIPTALGAGIISRPSICSLMTGIFDAGLELNEREAFWQGTVPTSLPVQLKKLGYETNYWYGGSLANGNFGHFAPGCGFDHAYGGTDICDPKAPRSWVGVYDHIFLNKIEEMVGEKEAPLQFHFIYTTSNHGPYKLPLHDLGFDGDKIMKVQDDVLKETIIPKVLGAYWYSDKAINQFILDMREKYPDSLFILTGDHGAYCSELAHTSFMDREYTFRELHCPVLLFNHPDLNKHSLVDNAIGGHMNILPTLFELIAPKGFTYYSLFESLTKPVDYCVTPYHWLNQDYIGECTKAYYQKINAVDGNDMLQGPTPYQADCEAEMSLTAYLLQHPEYLQPAAKLER